jgi:hypothetical protein
VKEIESVFIFRLTLRFASSVQLELLLCLIDIFHPCKSSATYHNGLSVRMRISVFVAMMEAIANLLTYLLTHSLHGAGYYLKKFLKNILLSYGTRRYITVFTKARRWTLS